MITLLSYPQGDADSRYYAVANPLLYRFQSNITSAGAFNVYNITLGFSSSGLYSGNFIGLVMPGDAVLVDNLHFRTVTEVTAQGIRFNQPITFVSSTLNVKSINNYRAEFRVFHGRKEQDQQGNQLMKQVGPVIEATPDSMGLLEFNVQPFLRPFVKPNMTLSSSRKNTNSVNNWGRFFLQWREMYDGFTGEWTPATPGINNMRWYVSAVRQLLTGGVTMYPYNSLFLSAFKTPDYLPGFTENEISFIYDSNEALRVKEERLNLANIVTGQVTTALLSDGREEVNRVRLAAHDSPFVRVTIETDPGYQEGYVQQGYVLEGYFEMI